MTETKSQIHYSVSRPSVVSTESSLNLSQPFHSKKFYLSIICLLFALLCGVLGPRVSLNLSTAARDNGQYYTRAYGFSKGLGFSAPELLYLDKREVVSVYPGLPLLLSSTMQIFGSFPWVAKITFFSLEFLAAICLFVSFSFYMSRINSFILTIGAILIPEVLLFFPILHVDFIILGFSALMFAVFAKFCSDKEKDLLLWFILGAGFGSLAWFRYSGISWSLAAVLWLGIIALTSKHKLFWKSLLVFLAGVGIMTGLMYMLICTVFPNFFAKYTDYVLSSPVTISKSIDSPSVINQTQLSDVGFFNPLLHEILDSFDRHMKNVVKFAIPWGQLSNIVVIFSGILFGLGLWVNRKRENPLLIPFFIIISGLPFFIVGNIRPRYMFPMIFFLWAPMVQGIEFLIHKIFHKNFEISRRQVMVSIILVISAAFFALKSFSGSAQCYRDHSPESANQYQGWIKVREMCYWIRENYDSEKVAIGYRRNTSGVFAWSGFPTFPIQPFLDSTAHFFFNDQLQDFTVLIPYSALQRHTIEDIFPWLIQNKKYLKLVYQDGPMQLYELDIQAYYNRLPKFPFSESYASYKPWIIQQRVLDF